MVASRKSRRQESRERRKATVENAAREFVKDLFSLIDLRREELFHLLPSEHYFSNGRQLTSLVAKCAIDRASRSLSRVKFGSRLLAATRPHLRVYAALRLDSPYPSMQRKGSCRREFDNPMIDFLEEVPTITGGPDLCAWTDFARRLCNDVDELATAYSINLRV
jgi:hypothetical protein